MEHIKEFFKKDKFAEYCGIELLEVSPGRAKAKMKLEEHHLNGLRVGHGGALFTLADLVFAAACNSHGNIAMAINVNINYIKAASPGSVVYAEGFENAKNPRLGSYTINITDGKGDLLGVFQGLAYRKKETIEA